MKKYIALLRAINVGGHRKIKMADLRKMFSSMGFENVITYIQSGNVIFDAADTDLDTLAQSIEQQIKSTFGYDVSVIIRSIHQLEELIRLNPFKDKDRNPFKLYITFFRQPPSDAKQQLLTDQSNETEIFRFVNENLFSLINKETGQKIRFSNNYVEKIIGIPGTTRNRNSLEKIFEIAANRTL